MRIRFSPSGLLRRNFLVLAILPAFLHAVPVDAQSAGADPSTGKHFSKDASFSLPISIDKKMRSNLKEVQLWVKAIGGDWQRQQVAPPSEEFFKYKAPADGEYWFTLVTVDPRGIAKPADLNRLTSQEVVMVVIDTQPPTVDIQPVKAANGEFFLRCAVNDANPDPRSLKLTYQGQDKVARAFEPMAGQPGTFRVPGLDALASPIRVTVSDLAENVTSREVSLVESMAKLVPAAQPAPIVPVAPPPVMIGNKNVQQVGTPLAPNANVANANVQQAVGQPATSIGSVVVQNSSPAPTNLSTVPPGPVTTTSNVQIIESRPTPITTAPASAAPSGGVQRQLLNTSKVSLEYRVDTVGPSGVGKVEVWTTADQGATWKRHCEDTDRRSPAEFDLPGDGLYGVRVVVTNGNGFGGRPPVAGDQPQMWIESDSVAPVVQLREVEPVASAGALDIRWTASDKNLGTEPISLFYATRREGPWQPVARGLKNDGSYRWAFPHDVGAQFFLRLEAIDQAGNVARCDSQNALVLDMTEPRTTVIGVTGIQVGSNK